MMKEPANDEHLKQQQQKKNNGASQTVGLKVKKQSYKRAYVGHSFETAIFIIDDYTNRK